MTKTKDASLEAELYDQLHRGHTGDVAFYVALCRDARHVLELGSGSGRVTTALAEAGLTVHGLEQSRAMMTLATQAAGFLSETSSERLTWSQGDMRHFTLGRRYDRIVLPYNTLYCLLDANELEGCLRCIKEHLAPEGKLGFDIYCADAMHDEDDEEDDDGEQYVVTMTHRNETYDVFERSRWQRQAQRLDTTYRMQPRGDSPEVNQTIAQRYLLKPQIAHHLERCGLRILHHEGGFASEPADDNALHHVIVATHATSEDTE